MNLPENNLAVPAPGQHFESEDLLLYVLEMLTPAERQLVEAHVGTCPQCGEELSAVREEMGAYAVASVESTASYQAEKIPAEGLSRLMAEVARTPSSGSTAVKPAMGLIDGGRVRSVRKPVVMPWIGWGIAAAMAVMAGHFYQDRETMRQSLSAQAGQIAQLSADQARAREVVDALTDRSAQRVALSLTKAPAPAQPSGRATYLANKGTLIFLASHLDPLPAGKTYELWVIPASGKAPVPAGTFRPDALGNANVVTAKLEGVGAAKAIGVTIEASGGSTTPTMPIVLAGS